MVFRKVIRAVLSMEDSDRIEHSKTIILAKDLQLALKKKDSPVHNHANGRVISK